MNKKKYKLVREYKIVYKVSLKAEKVIKLFLQSKISSRELGKKLNCSHQQAINLISKICRQWITEEKLKIN